MKVLLVEPNAKIADFLHAAFKRDGSRVELAGTGEDALELMRCYEFDIVVLNLALPDMLGSGVVRRMRAAWTETPVLTLAAAGNTQPRITAFAAGADDVVSLPVDATELLARVGAIVRRNRGYAQSVLQVGAVSLNLHTHEVTVDGAPVQLTPKEFAILELLMLRRNMVLTKEIFLDHLYGGSADEPEIKIIDVFICKLRKKLAMAGAPDLIGTVWGRGYTVRDSRRDPHPPVTPQCLPSVGSRKAVGMATV